MKHEGWLRLGAAALACALTACGGGGGGDNLSVTADRTALTVAGVNGSSMTSVPVTFTLRGGEGTYYGMAESDSDEISASFMPDWDNTAVVSIWPAKPLDIGTRRTGQVTFKLCSDEHCQHPVWSQKLPYTMTMYQVDTSPITIAGNEGAAAVPVSRTIVPADPGKELVFGSSEEFMTVDHSAGDMVTFTASAVGLSKGIYSAEVQIGIQPDQDVSPSYGGYLYTLFTVGDGIVAPAIGAIDVVATSTVDSLSGQAPIQFAGTQSPAWTAQSDSAWLVLDTAAGSSPGSLRFHVDRAKVSAMPNWTSSTANITLSAAGLSDTIVPVTLNKSLAEVTMATPGSLLPGQASTVRVRGRGLTQLSGAGGFVLGGTQPTGVTIESDSSAVLELPALAEGKAVISTTNALGESNISSVAVGVIPAGTFVSGSVAHSGLKRAAVFDPTRRAIFATDMTQNALVRYQWSNGQWTVTALPIAAIGTLVLSPDRQSVYVVSGARLVAVNPDTMKTRAAFDAPEDLTGGRYFTKPAPVSSDLRAWFGGDQWTEMIYFDLTTETFAEQSVGDLGPNGFLHSPSYFAPADGSAVMIVNSGVNPPFDNLWYTSAGRALTAPSGEPKGSYMASFGDSAATVLLDGESLYRTSDFSLLGLATVSNQGGYVAGNALLSPDGRRIYRQVLDGTGKVHHITAYDATRTVTGGSSFVELGTIALPVQASECSPWDYLCDAQGRLVIDPTGTTLFWVGDAKLVVVPIPEGLSGVSASTIGRVGATSRLRKAASAATVH